MLDILVLILRGLLFLAGALLVGVTLLSAVRTFVLPRSAPDPLVRGVFAAIRRVFDLRARFTVSYEGRDRVMAFYAPVSLLALLPVWYSLVMFGYAAMYWAAGLGSWYHAIRESISSITTLGFEPSDGLFFSFMIFTEAVIGLILVALLLSYLPTMYAAFARREAAVTMLEVRAGDPPTAVELLKRYYRIQGVDRLSLLWEQWEAWFADIEESHTSLPALVFFRSPQPNHSWVTASGAVLDAAALTLSAVDIPYDSQAALCIRAGYLALRRIADYFGLEYPRSPAPGDPISIERHEFERVLAELAEQGVPLVADREQAWRDYSGWRVNYDRVLLSLALITMAPYAPWSSDRGFISDRIKTTPPVL